MSRLFRQAAEQRVAAELAEARYAAPTVAVRWSFIGRNDEQPAGRVPLAQILRGDGGRGGAVRLKLYLSLLWLGRGQEAPVFAFPSRQLANLIGLPDPGGAGARRIQAALRWLHQHGYVALDRRPGEATRIHLLDDAGGGEPYRDPGILVARKQRRATEERKKHFYIQLPSEFWTEGWIAHLSGAAIAMFLVALLELRGRDDDPVLWVAPRIGRERYDLSDETRNKGLRELVDLQLLLLQRRAVPQAFDDRYRARNMYRVNAGKLKNPIKDQQGDFSPPLPKGQAAPSHADDGWAGAAGERRPSGPDPWASE